MSVAGFAAVGIGAALGAWLRWALGLGLNQLLPLFPLGTLLANLIGGYLIGVAMGVFEQAGALPPETRLFVVTGFLGGLTTFSTFSAESVALLQSGRYDMALLHGAGHLAGSILLTILGFWTVRKLWH
jgi:CrcB protein